MKLESIDIGGFRGIQKLQLDFSERINVLVGVNGAGKSAVLDCTAIMLSRLIGPIRSRTGIGRFFAESDINNDLKVTHNEIAVRFQGERVRWRVSKSRRGRRPFVSELEELRKHVDSFLGKLEEDERVSLPLVVYYPVNRAVLDIPLRIRTRHRFDRLSAYDQALTGSPISFRIFFEWFREREDLENELRMDEPRVHDPQLQAVRTATERFMPGIKSLRVRRSPLRMVVEKDREELIVNQLSDGEKCTLAMVGDLARRMAIANPDVKDPLMGDAIVLIDEADLHLHPAWQRRLVPAFVETFPNCQFLLSTHSPAILSHLKPDNIWILKRAKKGIEATRPNSAYGQTMDRILEDIMDVPARPEKVKDHMARLFLAIERGKLERAERILGELQHEIGADPDLVKAQVLIRRKEVLGR